jgi:hypothetical protein
MNSDFEDLLKLFNVSSVRYLVVGGYAVMLYTRASLHQGFGYLDRSESGKFGDAWGNRQESVLGGQVAWFVGRGDLIKNKRASGRHIDLHDADLLGE